MAKFYDTLTDELRTFMTRQPVFFVSTAPARGRINLSPKGMNSFRCIDEETVAYLDLTGSGNETSAHLEENGRMTIMFCSFDKKPLILRLYGHGRVVRPQDPDWDHWLGYFVPMAGTRQIMVLVVDSVQTSCGYAVPVSDGMHERQTLVEWAEKKGDEKLDAYRREKNVESIDGLPTGW